MLKNLSMWMWEHEPDGEQAVNDTHLLIVNLYNPTFALNLMETNPPVNPGPGQLKKSGLLPVDQLIIEHCVNPDEPNRFLPLTQVIRERVIDKGAVKFEVAERVKHIFAMEGRRCGRKEVQSITDEVIESMLKDAPIREKRVFGIVTSMGKILVGATGKAAEDYISYIKSLFGEGHVRVRPASLGGWNPDCGIDLDDEDIIYLNRFAREVIFQGDLDNDHPGFVSNGSFQFSSAKEKFAVQNAKDATIENLVERIKASYVDYIELAHKHAVFKLTSDLTLKSIKLQDLDYTPENDEEVGLSAAYYRFYMSFFLNLFDTIVREVAKVNQEYADDVS